jgi:hypothetical protein
MIQTETNKGRKIETKTDGGRERMRHERDRQRENVWNRQKQMGEGREWIREKHTDWERENETDRDGWGKSECDRQRKIVSEKEREVCFGEKWPEPGAERACAFFTLQSA